MSTTDSRVRVCVRAAGPYRPRIEAMIRQFPDEVEFVEAPDLAGVVAPSDIVAADLLFLDVDVEGIDLAALATRIRELNRDATLVLISGSDVDAEPLREAGADELLDSEFSSSRLARVVVSTIAGREEDEEADAPAPQTDAPARFPRRLVIRSGTRWVVVDSSGLLRVEADGNYAVLVLESDRIRVRSTLGAIFSLLDPRQFFRIHRSMIIRLDQVVEIFNTAQGDYHVKLAGGAEATVTRSRRADFVAALQGAGAFGSID